MPDPRTIGIGAAVLGGRAGLAAARLALAPVRLAVAAPVVGPPLARLADGLSRDGREAVAELEQAADRLLAGPVTDAVARSVAEHHLAERLAAQILAQADLDGITDAVLEDERTERLIVRVLDSQLVDVLTARVLESPEMQRIVSYIATSPDVLAAVTAQSQTLAGDVIANVRERSEGADDRVEHRVRGWLHRPRPLET